MMNLITQTTDLEIAIAALRNSDFVTVDTEFIRETTFWPQLCLIQLASPDVTILIDPIAQDINLQAFFDLMVDKKSSKFFMLHVKTSKLFIILEESFPILSLTHK